MNEQVKILRAFRPGDVVFIEIPGAISDQAYRKYSEHLSKALEGTSVKAIILTEGIRVAAAEEHLVKDEEPAATP